MLAEARRVAIPVIVASVVSFPVPPDDEASSPHLEICAKILEIEKYQSRLDFKSRIDGR